MIENLHERRLAAREAGFTLIELLIVIVILGVLAGIVVFAVGGINDDSKTSACKSDKKTVETATEAFYAQADPHAYPAGATSAARLQALKDANVIKSVPSSSDYTITLAANGDVSADAC